MLRPNSRMVLILAVCFSVLSLVPVFAYKGEEPFLIHFISAQESVPAPAAEQSSTHAHADRVSGRRDSPPNPDRMRQSLSQPIGPVISDAKQQTSSPPVMSALYPDRVLNERNPASDRLARHAKHDHEPVLHDQKRWDTPARFAVLTSARREIFENVQAIAPTQAPTADSDRETAVRMKSEMGNRWEQEHDMWRSRQLALDDRRDRRSDGPLDPNQNPGSIMAAPVLNVRPLTEAEIKEKVKENNAREVQRVQKEHQHRVSSWGNNPYSWKDQEEGREWTEEQKENWRKLHSDKKDPEPWAGSHRFIVQPSWKEQDKYRRDHARRYSFYDRRRHRYYYPTYLKTTYVVLPPEFSSLTVQGRPYYYAEGTFYRRSGSRFVDTPPPMSAMVMALPDDHVALKVNGTEYFTYNGIYYKKLLSGFEVTDPPSGFEGVLMEYGPDDVNGRPVIIVSIPYDDQSAQVIEVELIEKDGGYEGPQGEFYPNFPDIEQLRKMYS